MAGIDFGYFAMKRGKTTINQKAFENLVDSTFIEGTRILNGLSVLFLFVQNVEFETLQFSCPH